MASELTLQRLQAEFDTSPQSIQALASLLEHGATPDFIARYRRDETGDVDQDRIAAIQERLQFLSDLDARKQAILQQAESRGMVTADLQRTVTDCFDQDQLDDIYQSFRPSRRTPGVQAKEKGLEEFTQTILQGGLGETPLPDAADKWINAEKELPTRESVLEGVLHIISEQLAADPVLRLRFRDELGKGILETRLLNQNVKGAVRYKEFFDFKQPVRRIHANKMLDLRHAEWAGIIQVRLTLPEGQAEAIMAKHTGLDVSNDPALADFMQLVYRYAYEDLIHPAREAEIRHHIKERADRETVQTLARSLRSQLMAPPLGRYKAIGLRASRKTACMAMLDADGAVTQHRTLDLEGEEKRNAAIEDMAAVINSELPKGIAIPHGRHQEISAELLTQILEKVTEKNQLMVPVDEAASAIHATSSFGRKAMSNLDVGVRTAASLARRLQDPMQELLALDPKALGLGHGLGDVHQGILTRHLDSVISSCVAEVGVDLNRANTDHLSRVPGLDRELAKKILEYRKANGPFKTLQQLQEVPGVSENNYLCVVGFLRIFGGEEPLDATGVHPENYALAGRIATAEGVSTAELLGRNLRAHDNGSLEDAETGTLRVRGVLQTLTFHGKDCRGELTALRNEGITKLEDLRPDMALQGRITSLADFGAFLDLGIGQDGLVHISQIPQSRLRAPHKMLSVGEVVKVYVLKVEPEGKRISLSMHKPRHMAEGRQPTLGERMQPGRGRRRPQDRQEQPQSRAARAPEGRRGNTRQGRRPPTAAGAGGQEQHGFSRGRGGSRHDGDMGRRGREPRVITVESGKPVEESLGHKGEFRSLSALGSLLGKAESGKTQTPAEIPAPATPPTAAPQSAPQPEAPQPEAMQEAPENKQSKEQNEV